MTFEEAYAKIAEKGLLLSHLFEIDPKKVNHNERWRACISTGQGGDMWYGTSTDTAADAIEDALAGYETGDRRACGPAPDSAKPDEKRKKASKAKPKKPEPESEQSDEDLDAELAAIL